MLKTRRAMSGNRKIVKISFLHHFFKLFGPSQVDRLDRYLSSVMAWIALLEAKKSSAKTFERMTFWLLRGSSLFVV